MKNTLKIILIVIFAGIITFSYLNFGGNNKEFIKIGFIGSLSGVVPTYGEAMKGGVEIAVKEINARGGVRGKKIEVIYEDGKCIESKDAVSAAQKLIEIDRVNAVIGGGCSNEVMASAKLFNENEVVMLSAGASSPAVTDAGEYIFRNAPNDSETSIELAHRIVNDGFKTVGIISDQTEYSKGFRDPFIKEVVKSGGIVVFDATLSTNSSDLRTDLLKIMNTKADAIFINPNYPSLAGIIVKQAREIGIKSQFYMGFHATEDFLSAAGNYGEGIIVIGWPIPAGDKPQEVLSDFTEIYGHESTYKFLTLIAYDALNIVTDAIEKNGDSGQEIKTYIESLGTYEGSFGTYSFSKQGDATGFKFGYLQLRDGEFVSI